MITHFHAVFSLCLFLIALLTLSCDGSSGPSDPDEHAAKPPVTIDASILKLDRKSASAFAALALKGISKEYPNKPGHVMNDEAEVKNPAALHPAFYGCFDWHSAVHGHWMLVRLLKMFPGLPEEEKIRAALDSNLSAENILVEVEYLKQPNRKSFERTYGWAWLLKLAEELHAWDDPDGAVWSKNLKPLAEAMKDRYMNFLPRQEFPIRRGVHPNTAFGIAFALDYARETGHEKFEELLVKRARFYFAEDENYPAAWEPDGDDFFSRSLIEADLMRRILGKKEFSAWLSRFLPGLKNGKPETLIEPCPVSDRSDPKIVHLDGLNLSRAWCMRGIASALDEGTPVWRTLMSSAAAHAAATLPHITSGNYEGEHWLASFAVYMMVSGNAK